MAVGTHADPYRALFDSLLLDPRLYAPDDEAGFVQEFFRREQDLFRTRAERRGIPARSAYPFSRPHGSMRSKEAVRLARVSPLVTIAYAAWNRFEQNPSVAAAIFEGHALFEADPPTIDRVIGSDRARYERLAALTRWSLYAGDTLGGNPELYRVSFEDDDMQPIEWTDLARYVSEDVARSARISDRSQLVPASFLDEHLEGDPIESRGPPFRAFG